MMAEAKGIEPLHRLRSGYGLASRRITALPSLRYGGGCRSRTRPFPASRFSRPVAHHCTLTLRVEGQELERHDRRGNMRGVYR